MSAWSHTDIQADEEEISELFCKFLRSYFTPSLLICRHGSKYLKICVSLWFKGSAGVWWLWRQKGCENPNHCISVLRLDCDPPTAARTSFSLLATPSCAPLQGQSCMQGLLTAVYHKQVLFDMSFITFLLIMPYLRWWKGPADNYNDPPLLPLFPWVQWGDCLLDICLTSELNSQYARVVCKTGESAAHLRVITDIDIHILP